MENTGIEWIVKQFGGAAALAKELGHKHPTKVNYWVKVNRVPQWHWQAIIDAAKRRGFRLTKNSFYSGE